MSKLRSATHQINPQATVHHEGLPHQPFRLMRKNQGTERWQV